MNHKKILGLGFVHSLGVAAYVALVATIMSNGEKWFVSEQNHRLLGPIAILMLFTLSAAMVGSLIFLRPALWALDGKKNEALWLLLATLGWLVLLVIAAFTTLAIIKN